MRFLLASIFCVMLYSTVHADVLLFEDFEDNTVVFTPDTPLFHDGISDYFHITPLNGVANSVDPYTGFGGSNYFAVEDMDDGGSRPSTGTLSFLTNVTGATDLSVDLLFAAGGNGAATPAYDLNDGFLVRAQLDGGGFQNLLAFEAVGTTNELLRQDADFDGTGDAAGFLPSSAFTSFSDLAIVGTGNSLLVEVIFSSNDGNVEFAIDDFTINGVVPEPTTMGMVGMLGLGMVLRRRRK